MWAHGGARPDDRERCDGSCGRQNGRILQQNGW